MTVEAHLKGLELGNTYCRERLLRLLKVSAAYPVSTLNHLTDANISRIPSWVFLRFAPQLMGCLDLPEGPIAAMMLEKVAAQYPNALFYPFKITSEFLGQAGRIRSAKLAQVLQNDSMDCFVESLFGLTHPELRWSDGLKVMVSIIKSMAKSSNYDQAYQYFLTLRETTSNLEWSKIGSKIGLYNRKFAKGLQKMLDTHAGTKNEKIKANVKKVCSDLIEENKTFTMSLKQGKVPLVEFSEWLADFDALTHRIEIPGQYSKDTNRCPNVEQHEYIQGIDPMLLVMSSVRKPKRIKFYGTGGSENMFLVKGGEDLRNDERVEQLFVLMNSVVAMQDTETVVDMSILAHSASENPKNFALRARTYAVIPMTSKVGLLEWVSDTKPLKSIVTEEMLMDLDFLANNPEALIPASPGVPAELDIMSIKAADKRLEWMGDNTAKCYHQMYKTKDRRSVLMLAGDMATDVPQDFLRRKLMRMSSSPEAFFTLRSEFAKTLAVSSIFGYVLGLGDRHLDNLLMDMKTGNIIQIDFGICFGMGSSMLPVPELIPFRLTPQLRSVLMPLDGVGLLRHWMVQCMERLRSEQGVDMISNALEIYINDPVVEWMKSHLTQREEMMNQA